MELEEKITVEIIKIEEVEKMTYVTNAERIGEKRGIKIGEDRKAKKIAIKMLKRGHSVEDVMEITDLTREEVLAIKGEMDF
jgi:uncharacterized protein YegJ (DUF2314 family)